MVRICLFLVISSAMSFIQANGMRKNLQKLREVKKLLFDTNPAPEAQAGYCLLQEDPQWVQQYGINMSFKVEDCKMCNPIKLIDETVAKRFIQATSDEKTCSCHSLLGDPPNEKNSRELLLTFAPKEKSLEKCDQKTCWSKYLHVSSYVKKSVLWQQKKTTFANVADHATSINHYVADCVGEEPHKINMPLGKTLREELKASGDTRGVKNFDRLVSTMEKPPEGEAKKLTGALVPLASFVAPEDAGVPAEAEPLRAAAQVVDFAFVDMPSNAKDTKKVQRLVQHIETNTFKGPWGPSFNKENSKETCSPAADKYKKVCGAGETKAQCEEYAKRKCGPIRTMWQCAAVARNKGKVQEGEFNDVSNPKTTHGEGIMKKQPRGCFMRRDTGKWVAFWNEIGDEEYPKGTGGPNDRQLEYRYLCGCYQEMEVNVHDSEDTNKDDADFFKK